MNKTRQLALTAILAAIYIVTNWIPFSQYIGGAGFITLSVVMVPVIAAILTPVYALFAGLIGGLGINIFVTGYAMVMPAYSAFIPAVAILLGSLAMHDRKYSWAIVAFLILEGAYYIFAYKFTATPVWLTHYIIAIILGLYYMFTNKFKMGIIYTTALAENAMLNIGSIFLLRLPATLWPIIFPASFIERIIAAVGAIVVIKGLYKALPTKLPELKEY